jgi:hypothetical protein
MGKKEVVVVVWRVVREEEWFVREEEWVVLVCYGGGMGGFGLLWRRNGWFWFVMEEKKRNT